MIKFPSPEVLQKFHSMLASMRSGTALSIFKARTEDSSAAQYFQFYGYLSQQQVELCALAAVKEGL